MQTEKQFVTQRREDAEKSKYFCFAETMLIAVEVLCVLCVSARDALVLAFSVRAENNEYHIRKNTVNVMFSPA